MFEKTKALCNSFLDMGIPGFDMIVYKDGQEVFPTLAVIPTGKIRFLSTVKSVIISTPAPSRSRLPAPCSCMSRENFLWMMPCMTISRNFVI